MNLPEILSAHVAAKWDAFSRALARDSAIAHQLGDIREQAQRVFAFSDFVSANCARNPALLADLVASGDLWQSYAPATLMRAVSAYVDGVADDDDLMRRLRGLRQREMVRIAWRDLGGQADLGETLADLTRLAEACLEGALRTLSGQMSRRYGQPHGRGGNLQDLVVLGMGKLGAAELNFSSDIDLIMTYPQAGLTRGGPQDISCEDFFTRLSRRLIKVIGTTTADGFVYRVDMDLRPFGGSGPLVINFDALEEYFIRQGREWERYAWIKAHPVAGDRAAGRALIERLSPFVYRRYLDYGVYESLREMKAGITQQLSERGFRHNIKLGAGGIREIEFFGQVFQLLRGGVVPDLRVRPILLVLERLGQEGLAPETVCRDLSRAYIFLRRVENRLQMMADQQTHVLPQSELGRWRLALSMGFENPALFKAELDGHRQVVHNHFGQLLAGPGQPSAAISVSDQAIQRMERAWKNQATAEQIHPHLEAAGYGDSVQVLRFLEDFRNDGATQALSPKGRARLDRLMPQILAEAAAATEPEQTLGRILDMLRTIQQRTIYLALLLENPPALRHLVRLAEGSPMIVRMLARYPLLLDDLLDPRTLYRPPPRRVLEHELTRRLRQVPEDDLELAIEALCVFKQTNVLRVAAADVTGALALMKVSDRLTDIAEVVLRQVVKMAWEHLVRRHGRPLCAMAGQALDKGFAVIAYGKLGGFELGYGSDLDLVFLHAGRSEGKTDGPQPLDTSQFFARLGQRVLHLLTARTAVGGLYEVDMRLRPSGSAGLLVSQVAQFEQYQRQTARIWEHQALIKARPVFGELALVRRFEEIRLNILSQTRNERTLSVAVIDMREQLRKVHKATSPELFHLKHDQGGMLDIEFLVQYLVLRFAPAHQALLEWTDNVRLIHTLIESGQLPEHDAYLLREAYLTYRMVLHRLSLQAQPAQVDPERFRGLRREIGRIWKAYLN